MSLPWLEPYPIEFPAAESALPNPNGLLAAGGGLSTEWLLCAYRQGIFPWYESGQPILWWSPDPRLILLPEQLKISKSLKKLLKKHSYTITFDKNFPEVMSQCAAARKGSPGTWITKDMQAAYIELHKIGFAHSIEVHSGPDLVGGLYGVALGKVFFGESMFSKETNTSKLALVYLVRQLHQWDFELIDCQITTEHLVSLGATEISRVQFRAKLQKLIDDRGHVGIWQLDPNLMFTDHETKFIGH